MKIETFRDKLRWGIALVERITGKNLSLPALSCIFLAAKERALILRATNLDLGIEVVLPAKIEESGEFLITGATLVNFLTNLNRDDKIKIETINNNLAITTTHTKTILTTHPTDDFPSLPKLKEGASFTLPTQKLLAGLRMVAYAASLSDIKPEIASVYLYQDNGDLVFVATDSFRLAEKRIVLEQKIKIEMKLILPIRNCLEIIRVLENENGEIKISFNQNQISLTTETIFLTSRLVDGVFPDYKQIMPTSSKTNLVVLKNELLNALKLAVIFSDKLNQITLRLSTKNNLCEIYSHNNETGENTTNLEATLEGEDLEAGYNVRYLLDCFQSISADSISLSFNTKNRPLQINGIGDNTFNYLVMPLNR